MYYITFIDYFSRYTKIYLLRNKDKADEKFLIYKSEVENQFDKKIKRGGEYDSSILNAYCDNHGITHEVRSPYSFEINGVATRKNITLKNMVNAMLISSGAPLNLWEEAILSAWHVQNRILYKKTRKRPCELWGGSNPNLSYLKVQGCLVKVLKPIPKRTRQDLKLLTVYF